MDWAKLFFSPDGRIRRQEFWIGWAILFAASLVLGFVPLINFLVFFVSIYVSVCLYAKRLHDMGHTAWWELAPFGFSFVMFVVGLFLFGSAMIAGAFGGWHPGIGASALALGGLGGLLVMFSLAGLVHLAFLIWVGATPGQLSDNRFGPAPGTTAAADVF